MAIRAAASGDYLIRTAGGFYDPAAMSICFWINLLIDKDASGALFGIRNSGNNNGYVYYYNPNGDGVTYGWESFDGTNTPQLDMTALALNTWHFIALSRSGTGANQTTAYRRAAGVDALTSATGTFAAGQTINEEVALSNGFNLAAGFFPGRIAALKQWSAPLTEAELLAESYRYRPIRLANLHSWRPMIAPTVSEAALDFSGNARDLTPNGALTIEDGPPVGWKLGGRRFFLPTAAGAIQQMAGVSTGRSSAQGALTVARGLAGRTGGESGASGTFVALRGMAGRVAGSSAAQGTFTAVRRFAGMAQGIGRAIGSLFLSSEFLNRLAIDDQTIAVTWEDDRIIDGASWEDDRTFALPHIGMTKTGVKIKPVAIGDDFRVKRTYTTLPPGVVITKAWFTVKKSEKESDADALIHKEVTIAPTANGQITDADTAGGSIAMYFDPSRAETIKAKAGLEYVHDVKVLASNGQIHTLEKGSIPFIKGVTQKTS